MNRSTESGQSLVELLIALSVGGILLGSAATLLQVALRASAQDKFSRAAASLSEELVEKVTVFAGEDWRNIYDLQKGATYQLAVQGGSFVATDPNPTSPATVTIDDAAYTPVFLVDNVYRNECGTGDFAGSPSPPCPSPGNNSLAGIGEDPSTQKLTVTTSWNQDGGVASISFVKYVTRSQNRVLTQTDWSGGGGQTGLWQAQNKFDASSGINFGTAGEIKL